MEIHYIAHSCFKLKGKSAVLITDPFDQDHLGIKFPNEEADVVTISHEHPDHNAASLVKGSPVVVRGPGEYEVKGIKVFGFKTFHDAKKGAERGTNTIYQISIDNINLLHLGDIGDGLTGELLEKIKTPDVLFIPVGGVWTIDSKIATEIIANLEPKIIIPMHFYNEKIKNPDYEKLLPVMNFLKIMGKENLVPVSKLKVVRDTLPHEAQVVLLGQ